MATQNELIRGSITVALGSKQWEIKQLNWGAEKEWRLRVGGYLNRLPMYADILTALSPTELISNQVAVRETFENGVTVSRSKAVELSDKQKSTTAPVSSLEVNLTKVLQQGIATLTQYPEAAYDLLLVYSPQLATLEARADMDEHGTTQQVITAFMEVMKMSYPFFSQLTGLLSGRKP